MEILHSNSFIIIPRKLFNKLSSLLFDKTKKMYLRKYPDHIFIFDSNLDVLDIWIS